MSGTIVGTSGDDTYLGNANNNRYEGRDGDDIAFGRGGNDNLSGELGNDTLDGGIGNDALNGGDDDDLLIGGDGNDNINGGTGLDVASVEANLADIAVTVSGNRWSATSAEGTDALTGIEVVATGDDSYILLVGNSGFSDIQAAATYAQTLTGNVLILVAAGEYGAFTLSGGSVDSTITVRAAEPGVIVQGTFRADSGLDPNLSFTDQVRAGNAGTAYVTSPGITIGRSGVTLDGIAVDDFGTGITFTGAVNDTVLTNVAITNTGVGIALPTDGAFLDGLTITGGSISDTNEGIRGWTSSSDLTGSTLANLTITGTTFTDLPSKGIYLEALDGATITGITMTDVGDYGRTTYGDVPANAGVFGVGIDINLKYREYDGAITISDFAFTNVGLSDKDGTAASHPGGAAIAIKARDDASYASDPATLTGAVTISDGTINGTATGIRIGEPRTDGLKSTMTGTTVTVTDVDVTNAVNNANHGEFDNRTTSGSLTVTQTDGENDTITVSPLSFGGVRVNAGAGEDTVTGGAGKDTLSGGADADELNGGAGDDRLVGNAGGDALNGGSGVDTAAYTGAVDVTATGSGWQVASATEGTDTLNTVEIVTSAASVGRTLLVGNGGYASLQAAIDAAEDGDTILVAANAAPYVESTSYNGTVFGLVIDKSVTIQGLNAAGQPVTDLSQIGVTVLSGAQSNFGTNFYVLAEGVTISGINFVAVDSALQPDGVNKAFEVVEDDFTLSLSKVSGASRLDAGTAIDVGAAIYFNDRVVDPNDPNFESAITEYHVDGNDLTGQVYATNGTGIGAANPVFEITDNLFRAQPGYSYGIGVVGVVSGTGYNNAGAVAPTVVEGNVFEEGVEGYFYVGQTSTVEGVDRAYFEDFVDENTVPRYAFAVDTATGEPRSEDFGGSVDYATIWSDTTDASYDAETGDTLIVNSGGDTTSQLIYAEDLTVVARAGSDGLNLQLDTGVLAIAVADDDEASVGEDVNVTGNASDNTVAGNSGANVLNGAGGNDSLAGNAGNDELNGGTGNDTLAGGEGDDVLGGDAGLDTARFTGTVTDISWNGTSWIVETQSEGTDTLAATTERVISPDGTTWLVSTAEGLQALFDGDAANGEAATGDTVLLAEGTYTLTSTLVVDAGVTIKGPNAGLAGTAAGRGDEAVIDGSIVINSADKVVVDGVTFARDIPAGTAWTGVQVTGFSAATHEIVHSVFSRSNPNPLPPNDPTSFVGGGSVAQVIGIELSGVPAGTGILIADNYFFGENPYVYSGDSFVRAIYLNGGAGSITIEDNTFERVRAGINADNFNSSVHSVTDNTFTTVGSGVVIALPAGGSINSVTGNVFDNVDTDLNLRNAGTNLDVDLANLGNTVGGAGQTFVTTAGSGSDTIRGSDAKDLMSGNDLSASATDADLLDGRGGDDGLSGQGGNDTLLGGAGTDTLQGGAGNDSLDGGTGDDVMAGGTGDDLYVVDSSGDVVTEAANQGTDSVSSSVSYSLDGSEVENLILLGTAANGTGSAGANVITGNGADNVLSGGGGNDTLSGALGADTLRGGAGDDSLDGGGGTDTATFNSIGAVTVSLAAGTATGQGSDTLSEIENVVGSDEGDSITGDGLANRLEGMGGNDTLAGGAGNDALVGGAGNDVYVLEGTDVVTEAAAGGTDEIQVAGTFDLNAVANVENLTLLGTGNDTGTGNGDANRITGNTGANQLFGNDGNDTLVGGDGDDTVIGGAGADNLQGGAGIDTVRYDLETTGATIFLNSPPNVNGGSAEGDVISGVENVIGTGYDDLIFGSSAANNLQGGAGDDSLSGEAGSDVLVGGVGADTISGGSGSDTVSYAGSSGAVNVSLAGQPNTGGDAEGDVFENDIENIIGSSQADRLVGNTLANSLSGGNGDDTVIGGSGADTLSGGGGTDTLSYETTVASVVVNLADSTATGGHATGDVISSFENATGGSGSDILTGSSAKNVLIGGGGNDTLSGAAGSDTLQGDGGHDSLLGGQGSDTLLGGIGNDTLVGGASEDALTGGTGADRFVYNDATQDKGVDRILDFNRTTDGDTIDLSLLSAGTFSVVGSHTVGNANEITLSYTAATSLAVARIYLDGDATVDLTLQVTTTHGSGLLASDFVL